MLLAGTLSIAAADTSVRLPGTSMRLGTPIERIAAFGEFGPPGTGQPAAPAAPAGVVSSNQPSNPAAPPGVVAREGPARFFGVPAAASLWFESGRLAQVRFVVEDISPHSLDYVEA